MASNANHFLDGPGLSRVWSKIKSFVKGTSSLVGARNTIGTVKNGSTVTNVSDHEPCPIVNGIPYYKNTITTYNRATTANDGLMANYQVTDLNNAFQGVSRTGVSLTFQRVSGTPVTVTMPNAGINTTGVVKTNSNVTSVPTSSGYYPCPIVGGIPYYQNTNTTYSTVGAKNTTGLVKNGSDETSAFGYTACPIIGGIPYYKDTNTTYPVASGSANGLMPSYMFNYVYNLGDIKNSATGTNVTYTTTSTSNSWVSAGSITVPQGIWIIHAVAQFPKVSPGTTRRYGFSLAASSSNLDSTNVRRDMSDADCTGATYLQVTAFMNNSANAGLYFGIKSDPGVSGLEIGIAYTMIRLK